MQPSCERSSTVKFTFLKPESVCLCRGVCMCVCVLEPNSSSALGFSLQDQCFHPWVQSTALADGSGRADTYYHLMEGEESRRSEGNEGTRRSGWRDEGGKYQVRRKRKPCGGSLLRGRGRCKTERRLVLGLYNNSKDECLCSLCIYKVWGYKKRADTNWEYLKYNTVSINQLAVEESLLVALRQLHLSSTCWHFMSISVRSRCISSVCIHLVLFPPLIPCAGLFSGPQILSLFDSSCCSKSIAAFCWRGYQQENEQPCAQLLTSAWPCNGVDGFQLCINLRLRSMSSGAGRLIRIHSGTCVCVCKCTSPSSSLSGSFVIRGCRAVTRGCGLCQEVSPSIFPYTDLLRWSLSLASRYMCVCVCVCECCVHVYCYHFVSQWIISTDGCWDAFEAQRAGREGQSSHDSVNCWFSIKPQGSPIQLLHLLLPLHQL